MQKITKKPRPSSGAAVLAALVTVVVMADLLVTLWLTQQAEFGGPETGMLVLVAISAAAVIAGVLAAMVQRLREIRKGEWDDAGAY